MTKKLWVIAVPLLSSLCTSGNLADEKRKPYEKKRPKKQLNHLYRLNLH